MSMSPWTFREKYHKFCDVSTTVNQGDIPFIIWLFENPKSWFHLNGACDLKKHDMIHVLLECDQSNADEAFVIGFTMGNDKNIKPIFVNNGWLELDSINDYEIYNQMYEENSISNLIKLEEK